MEHMKHVFKTPLIATVILGFTVGFSAVLAAETSRHPAPVNVVKEAAFHTAKQCASHLDKHALNDTHVCVYVGKTGGWSMPWRSKKKEDVSFFPQGLIWGCPRLIS